MRSTSSSFGIALPDRFELLGELGRGGMAVVYRAHDLHLDRPVAIKVIQIGESGAGMTERFRREIGVTAKLVHPGIVALFDSGESDGHLYYVMPLVAGDTLRARLHRAGKLPMAETASIGADVAEALAYAHGSGIIHRDVKPENIFLVEGRAVLADFGIARAFERAHEGTTTTAGMVVGTMTYMSPEQASGDPGIDGRADLYSLGCVLYELALGRPPFSGNTALAVLAKHMTDQPRPLRAEGADVSEEFDALVMRLLAKDAADRGANAGEIAPLLRHVVTSPRIRAVRPATHHAPAPTPATPIDRVLEKASSALGLVPMGGADAQRRIDEAKAYLDAAEKMDPTSARYLVTRSRWHYMNAISNRSPEENVAIGWKLLLEAMVADDNLPDLQVQMSKVALYFEDDFPAAERAARKSVELNPEDYENLRMLSIVQKINGQMDESIATAKRATELAPGQPGVWNALGDSLLAAGRNAEAVIALQRAISLHAAFLPALERLELARVRLGEIQYALETRVTRLKILKLHERGDRLEAHAREVGPEKARLRDIRIELEEMLKQAETIDPFNKFVIGLNLGDRILNAYAELGEWSEAMTWVERAYERHPGRLRRILTDQPFDRRGLAADARYARLLRVAGLEELL